MRPYPAFVQGAAQPYPAAATPQRRAAHQAQRRDAGGVHDKFRHAVHCRLLPFIILGTLINTACGVDFITSLTASATCMGNVGPGFGEVGSMESFAAMPGVMKFSSTALMLFGRLEIFGLIQLFMIKWWV